MNKNMPPKMPQRKGVLKRVFKLLFGFYPVLVPICIFCILFGAVTATVPDLMIQKIIAAIEKWQVLGDWQSAFGEIMPLVLVLIVLYIIALAAVVLQTQLMAYVTQGFLGKMRKTLFNTMQYLPIKYFDTNKHGDIMSRYTNDIDTLRQLISQAMPAILRSGVIVLCVLGIMLYFSVWMTLILLAGVVLMMLVSKKVGGGSAKYFVRQQRSMGKTEGYIQEMMNGQKVIKVFNREEKCIEDFEKLNEELYHDSTKAHAYANVLGPVIMNIGNVLYVIVAMAGGIMCLMGVGNLSFSGLPLSVSIIAAFLNMTKQFTGNVNQLSQQINAIAMAMAGAGRVFELMDEAHEADEGKVTLVRGTLGDDGIFTEKAHGQWYWKCPKENGFEYVKLMGDVTMTEVDFHYEEGKDVLHDVSVYAKPGQKVAFVGATGAGKTTITNLINRFYDIADGKIRYDGINVNKIKKSDLRRSLGIVLQETNLFTGTVMENIRYGNLDATDDQCRDAARLAGADDFISRLPQGYDTLLSNNGANLSQGQRQLIAIARAAVADPPVMILDEATSSIDTRTEMKIQDAFAKMMKGRTSFIVAHRLSTIRDADLILVMDKGRIIETGDHESLLSKGGFYAKLYNSQFDN